MTDEFKTRDAYDAYKISTDTKAHIAKLLHILTRDELNTILMISSGLAQVNGRIQTLKENEQAYLMMKQFPEMAKVIEAIETGFRAYVTLDRELAVKGYPKRKEQ